MIKNISQKASEWMTLAVVTLMYIALCSEADMYVPAFPEMVNYFSTTEDKIQLILSINFLGLCIAGLFCGPLSDALGRKKVLLIGMISFFLSSLGCVLADSFYSMLFWRFIQGMSASVPMVVGCAIFLDKYSLAKASQIVGIINSFISAAMAGAPILGAYLSNLFHWRANFVFICIIVGLALLGTILFIDETLPEENRKSFQLSTVVKDYFVLLKSFNFVGYSVIALLPFIAVVIYISNLSLILINHLGVSVTQLGYYQATTMLTYMISSALGAKLIAHKGVEFTKNLGSITAIIGGCGLLLTAIFAPTNIPLICLSMAIFAAGGSLTVGIFGMNALELFPHMKGTASAMQVAIRQLLAGGTVFISELTFNGTIVPVAVIIFTYIVISILWYWMIESSKSSLKITDPNLENS